MISSFLITFFFNYPSTTGIYTLSLHDALPISARSSTRQSVWFSTICPRSNGPSPRTRNRSATTSPKTTCSRCSRSEEHTSELQSRENLVCRLLLEKKNILKIERIESERFLLIA